MASHFIPPKGHEENIIEDKQERVREASRAASQTVKMFGKNTKGSHIPPKVRKVIK